MTSTKKDPRDAPQERQERSNEARKHSRATQGGQAPPPSSSHSLGATTPSRRWEPATHYRASAEQRAADPLRERAAEHFAAQLGKARRAVNMSRAALVRDLQDLYHVGGDHHMLSRACVEGRLPSWDRVIPALCALTGTQPEEWFASFDRKEP